MTSRPAWAVMIGFLCISSLGAGDSRAGDKPIVAVFDMEDRGSGVSPQVVDNLTDYLVVLLTEGGYRVVPRDQIRDRLKKQRQESYKACYDQKCQVELGLETGG